MVCFVNQSSKGSYAFNSRKSKLVFGPIDTINREYFKLVRVLSNLKVQKGIRNSSKTSVSFRIFRLYVRFTPLLFEENTRSHAFLIKESLRQFQ